MRLALIPARAGSKGIKNKNLALLGDKPLLFYTLQAAKKAKCIDSILVSSDGDEILEYAQSQGVEILERPKSLAQDNTKTNEVLLHAIKHLSPIKTLSDIILLQPTSPFREAHDIDNAYTIYKDKNYTTLLSVLACDNKILKAFVLNDSGNLRGICNDMYPFMPRQELPSTFMSNGAIYIVNAKTFLSTQSFFSDNTGYYCMNEISSFDIDTPDDLERANKIVNQAKFNLFT